MLDTTLTTQWLGVAALLVFVLAYAAVIMEERLRLRKSVPMLIAAGLIWLLVGIGYTSVAEGHAASELALDTLLEYAQLLLFLVPAMTFVNTLQDRGLFDAVRARLVRSGLSLRALFWVTGGLAFMISPLADNLTTALVMGAVATTVPGRPAFVALACVNVVVAANAGGAFSPFGDITTLMVWQAGYLSLGDFLPLVLPSVVNWLLPAAILSIWVGRGWPLSSSEQPRLERGAVPVLSLFLATIALTVSVHTFLMLPAALGMMAGLGLLKVYSYAFNQHHRTEELVHTAWQTEGHRLRESVISSSSSPVATLERTAKPTAATRATLAPEVAPGLLGGRRVKPLDIFGLLQDIEWDTLMFFYGVMLCVGGLGAFGHLVLASNLMYGAFGATGANVLVGLLSAAIDNVPIMFAVLSMGLDMSQGQWLLVTLTAGVGGSLLSIGSAAGVALMGQGRGAYTFMAHLRWTWAIALGYLASIGVHLVLNRRLFTEVTP